MLKVLFFNVLLILALSAVAVASESAIGDGDHGKEKNKNLKLNNKTSNSSYSFSLRSGMSFKGENLLTNEQVKPNAGKLNFNNSDFQKTQNSYLLPYKKKVIFNKLTFNPNELLRNYSR